MTPEDIQSAHDFTQVQNSSNAPSVNKIKVVGVGGGGSNAINHMYNLGVDGVSFIVANTDLQALNNSPVPTKVLLGPTVTRGRGAGNDPDRARRAAEESSVEMEKLFDDTTDMVFITAGMGGGTGTGASPVIAKLAREKGILTIGIVTIPFLFEGNKKIIKALDGAKEMAKYVDALLVINNERLSDIYKDWDFLNAFAKVDDILSMAAMSISEIVTCDGFINLDFNDVDTTLRDGGTAMISTGYGEGENRVTKAIEDALNSPLLRNKDIFSSRKLLFNLYFSKEASDSFRIDETNQITQFVSNIDPQVDVIWGVAIDNSLGDKVKFTILAAGFDITISEDTIFSNTVQDTRATHVDKDAEELDRQNRLAKEYGTAIEGYNRIKTEQRYIILKPEQFDNEEVIDVLEQNPAFNRDKNVINNLKNNLSAQKSAAPASNVPKAQVKDGTSRTIQFDDL